MGDVVLRAATAADAKGIALISAAARTSADIPNLHSHDEDVAFFGRLAATKTVMIAEVDGVPVGFAAIDGDWLDHLWIAPSHQRRGIGRALLEWARSASPTDLKLYVFAHNRRAIAFYEAHGAARIAESDGQGNEEKLPDLTLLLRRP